MKVKDDSDKTMSELTESFIHFSRQLMVARQTVPFKFNDEIDENILSILHQSTDTYKTEVCNATPIIDNTIYWKDIPVDMTHLTVTAMNLASAAAKIDDYLVFQGENKNGLLYSAGNVVTEPLDFLTCGHATKAVHKGQGLLFLDGYDTRVGSNLILNGTQYKELVDSRCTFGAPDHYHVIVALFGGLIYQTEIPNGCGLLLPILCPPPGFFHIKLNLDWQLIKIEDNIIRICMSMEPPVIDEPNFICRLENI